MYEHKWIKRIIIGIIQIILAILQFMKGMYEDKLNTFILLIFIKYILLNIKG